MAIINKIGKRVHVLVNERGTEAKEVKPRELHSYKPPLTGGIEKGYDFRFSGSQADEF